METIKFFVSKLFIVIIILIIFAFLYWMATLLVPFLPKTLKMSGLGNATSTAPDTEFWLPTPGSLSLRPKSGGEPGRIEFEEYGEIKPAGWDLGETANQVSYAQNVQVFDSVRAGFSRDNYVRAISVYEGARVYGGLTFTGEAKEAMFLNGVFSLFVLNPTGQVIGRGEARMSDNGARTEWRRFRGKILTQVGYTGPGCTLVFQQQRPSGFRITLPVVCN
jgi:hypothetical protein